MKKFKHSAKQRKLWKEQKRWQRECQRQQVINRFHAHLAKAGM